MSPSIFYIKIKTKEATHSKICFLKYRTYYHIARETCTVHIQTIDGKTEQYCTYCHTVEQSLQYSYRL